MRNVYKIGFLCAAAVGIITAAAFWISLSKEGSRPLRVLFPVVSLKKDNSLLDPRNLDTIYEYYLLENLGIGLIRDDVGDPRGFRGLLADEWRQQDARTWEFILKTGMQWSDGSEITGESIAQHFLSFKGKPSRHLVQLTNIEMAGFDAKTRRLTLVFNTSTNEGILHELSLADSVLVHPSNQKEWSITSGPYRVLKYDPDALILSLGANENSPLLEETLPEKLISFG